MTEIRLKLLIVEEKDLRGPRVTANIKKVAPEVHEAIQQADLVIFRGQVVKCRWADPSTISPSLFPPVPPKRRKVKMPPCDPATIDRFKNAD